MVGEQYFQFGCRYSITGLDSKSMSKMVFIGDGLSKKAIYENFVKTDKYKKIKYKKRTVYMTFVIQQCYISHITDQTNNHIIDV